MEELLEKLNSYRKEIDDTEINGADAAEAYRIRFLGTKGIVKNLFQEIKNVPAEKKKEFGQILNEFKQHAESKYESSKDSVNGQRSTVNEKDLIPPRRPHSCWNQTSDQHCKKSHHTYIRSSRIFSS